jgi:glycosyltransferase involved in cell wall biosynthesis
VSAKLRISIIIPCFNEERYLRRCLDAIARLHEMPYEVLVVDNNSSDRTARIAQQYSFVRLLQEPRQGRVYAQASGFTAARGDILARIDADAVLPPDWTVRIAQHYSLPAAADSAWTGGPDFYNVRLPRLTGALYGFVGFTLNQLLTGHPSLWGSSMALPRSAWNQVQPQTHLRPDIHEDLDLAIQLYRSGYRIVHDRQCRVGVELRPIYAKPRGVWQYLSMWPRTLQLNGIHSWPLCWPVNFAIFVGMPVFSLSDRLARLMGRRPLG